MQRATLRHAAPATAVLALASIVLTTAQPSLAAPTEATEHSATFSPSPQHGLTWDTPCPQWAIDREHECGTLTVPMDYFDPSKGDIELFVTKRPADDQDNKMGTLFTNPGGPGVPGAQYTRFFAKYSGEDTRKHFDIIGIDPRGLPSSSHPFFCGYAKGPRVPVFPLNTNDYVDMQEGNKIFRDECVKKGNEIGNYMSAADLARDINLANDSLGEDKINFSGVSYGTHVATTLANMFPNKIRTVAAISALDPVQWTTGYGLDGLRTPAFQRVGSADGAKATWAAAIDACEKAGVEKCAVAETIREDWDLLHAEGRDATFHIGRKKFTYDTLADELVWFGYLPDTIRLGLNYVSSAASQLRGEEVNDVVEKEVASFANPSRHINRLGVPEVELADDPDAALREGMGDSAIANLQRGFVLAWSDQPMMGIMCGETINPVDPTQMIGAQQRNRELVPGEGESRSWYGAACINWPFKGQNAYKGPFNKKPSAPMLIIQNEYDTATPYRLGAKKLHEMTPDSRMILLKDGFGHAAYRSERCSISHLNEYFMTGNVPDQDLVCSPEEKLFED